MHTFLDFVVDVFVLVFALVAVAVVVFVEELPDPSLQHGYHQFSTYTPHHNHHNGVQYLKSCFCFFFCSTGVGFGVVSALFRLFLFLFDDSDVFVVFVVSIMCAV